jgi:hypothetical protein
MFALAILAGLVFWRFHMKGRLFAVLAILVLPSFAACSHSGSGTTSDNRSYEIREPVSALAIEAHAAVVTVEAGDATVVVKELLRFTDRKPTTSHRMDGATLRLTESGCGDGANLRCDVEYQIRVPRATATEIRTEAGAVILRGLDGRFAVTTEAGAVKGERLTSDEATVVTKAGATTLQFLEAPSSIRSESDVGAIEVRVPGNESYAVDVSATAGGSDVTVTRDPAAVRRINIRTQIGAVKVAPA